MTRCELILRAKYGKRDELVALLERLELTASFEQLDLLGIDILVPLDDPEVVLVTATWPSPAHADRWFAGPGWTRMSLALAPFLAAEPHWHVYRLVDAVA
jgi:quinol monooxygenase YgiN